MAYRVRVLIGSTCIDHTPQPEGYMQWHSWAYRMMRTHKQLMCEQCGLWSIWVPKDANVPIRITTVYKHRQNLRVAAARKR